MAKPAKIRQGTLYLRVPACWGCGDAPHAANECDGRPTFPMAGEDRCRCTADDRSASEKQKEATTNVHA